MLAGLKVLDTRVAPWLSTYLKGWVTVKETAGQSKPLGSFKSWVCCSRETGEVSAEMLSFQSAQILSMQYWILFYFWDLRIVNSFLWCACTLGQWLVTGVLPFLYQVSLLLNLKARQGQEQMNKSCGLSVKVFTPWFLIQLVCLLLW